MMKLLEHTFGYSFWDLVAFWINPFLIRRRFESSMVFPRSAITWLSLPFLGVLGTGLAILTAYYLMHEIGSPRTSMVTYPFPLVGMILGVTTLEELLTWQLVIGVSLIILILVIINLHPKRRQLMFIKHSSVSD